jgi:hypothetical protein
MAHRWRHHVTQTTNDQTGPDKLGGDAALSVRLM